MKRDDAGPTRSLAGRLRLPGLPGRGARDGNRRSVRGAAELSVLAVIGSLVTGVFFGSGISNTAVDIADGLTWIGDGPSGEVIQVNPATGRPQLRLKVAEAGSDLSVAQYDGRTFVLNRSTGELQSFDITKVLRSAARRVTQGEAVDTLTRDGELYLVDRSTSTIARLDPGSLDELGAIWTSDAGLADAALDGSGRIWALEDDGALHTLEWSDTEKAFDETDEQDIDLSGPESVLVAHADGVTVFGPDQGIVHQVGTSPAVDTDAPRLGGKLLAPERAPSDLVPASAPATGTVVLTTPEGVLEVDVAAIGCSDPGTPEVFEGVVYVPCMGAGKVLRLGRDGTRVQPDIQTPGSPDPELVLDDDNLIVNTPGSPTGAVVKGDGQVSDLVRYDDTVPSIVPGTTDDPPAAKPAALIDEILGTEEEKPKDKPKDKPKPPASTPTSTPTSRPTPGPDDNGGPITPPSSIPTSLPTSLPLVPTTAPTRGPTGNPPNSAPTKDPSAPPTGNPTGNPRTGNPTTPPSTPPTQPPSQPPTVPPSSPPTQAPLDAPTGVMAQSISSTQVRVSWTHTGGADSFVVSRATGGDLSTVPGTNRQATVSVQPGTASRFVVTAVRGSQRSTSEASGSVTTTDTPSAAPGLTGTATYLDYRTFRVSITWGEAPANGSPVTSYEVAITGPEGVRRTTTDGSGRSATTTWSCTGTPCTVGGAWSARVTAINGVGRGADATTSGPAPARPDGPLPGGGRQHVSSSSTSAMTLEGDGTTTLRLNPAADWSSFSGTCGYTYEGNDVTLPCGATTLDVQHHTGIIQEPGSGTVGHVISFYARNGNGAVRSTDYSWTTSQPTLCQGCQIP